MTKRSGALSGSKASPQARSGLGPSGYDPARGAIPGDIIQITNPAHRWFPCLMVVSERKAFGVQAFAFMPHNDGTTTGEAYLRVQTDDFEPVGAPAIMMSSDLYEDRMAEQGQTTNIEHQGEAGSAQKAPATNQ